MQLVDFILHVDKYLGAFVTQYGPWVYALLFIIVFVETGVVVMPFLPGDSLLFVVGAMCGAGLMSYPLAVAVLLVAAILGDQCNYSIGRYFGPKVFQWEDSRFFNRKAFDRAHQFYERYGGVTVILARFMPFIRTFVPFVAGVAEMTRSKFTFFNVTGALIWVLGIVTAGYLFGNLPWVQANLSKIIWALIIVPGLIAIYGGWKAGRAEQQGAAASWRRAHGVRSSKKKAGDPVVESPAKLWRRTCKKPDASARAAGASVHSTRDGGPGLSDGADPRRQPAATGGAGVTKRTPDRPECFNKNSCRRPLINDFKFFWLEIVDGQAQATINNEVAGVTPAGCAPAAGWPRSTSGCR